MKFYISKSDLEKVNRGCDLGDSVGVRVYIYPHVDSLPELVEFSYVEPKAKKKLYGWMVMPSMSVSFLIDGTIKQEAINGTCTLEFTHEEANKNIFAKRAPQFDCEVEL